MQFGPLLPKILECKKRIIVLQGGGDSLKTTSILQAIAVKHTQEKRVKSTITSVDLPKIRGGPLETFKRYAYEDVAPYVAKYNESSLTYYYRNGGVQEFKAFEDDEDAKGSEREYLFVNECNAIPYMLFWQLQRKTKKQIFLDYNPTARFWVHDKILPGPSQEPEYRDQVQAFFSDHRHNPFLSKAEHDRYENIRDKDLFNVYARGKTGKVRGLIFGHFQKLLKWEEELIDGKRYINGDLIDRILWGGDYGFTNDPTAFVKICVSGRKRYLKECCYTPGLSDDQICDTLVASGWEDEQVIYSETATGGTDMINRLRQKGLPVYPAIKAVAPGISKVREYDCYYYSDFPSEHDPSMSNFEKEVTTYKFLEGDDLITGASVMLNVPVDGWDHLCDASRYGIYTDTFRYPEGN